jgi:hypothetical protein
LAIAAPMMIGLVVFAAVVFDPDDEEDDESLPPHPAATSAASPSTRIGAAVTVLIFRGTRTLSHATIVLPTAVMSCTLVSVGPTTIGTTVLPDENDTPDLSPDRADRVVHPGARQLTDLPARRSHRV